MNTLWFLNKVTGIEHEVGEGSVMHDIVMADEDFVEIEDPTAKKPTSKAKTKAKE